MREPRVDFVDAGAFVFFCALGEGADEAGEIHPGGVAEDEGALGVVLVEEGAQEEVEIVGGCGEVEPGWV